MATIKQRVHRFNGTDYDTIHYETSSACVLLSNGNYLSSYESRLTSTETIANGGTGQTTAPKAIGSLINSSNTITASGLATNDYMVLYDTSATTGKKITMSEMSSYFSGHSTAGKIIEMQTISLGTEYTYDNKTWVVVHKDYSNLYLYLMLKNIYSTTQFGSNTTYRGSTLASVASTFESNLGSTFKSQLVSVTCKGVTSKVFVPTYSHMFGTNTSYDSTTFEQMHFDYFPANTSESATRVGYYNGSAQYWWTSSAYDSGDVYTVNADGRSTISAPSYADGFRPCVCLDYNLLY